MTSASAEALHARVALYMQDWDTAIEYSSTLIDEKKATFQLSDAKTNYTSDYTYFDYMWAYDLGYEVIWRIGFTDTSYGGALGTVFLNFNKDYTYFYPDYVPGQAALDLYDDADLRYSGYFYQTETGYAHGLSWPLLVKYYGNRNLITNQIYHVSMPKPFRLAEQYLIRAERVRELYMEGFRLHDLKRWHKGFERKPQANSQAEGSSLKIEADNPLFVWPIPQHELEAPGSEILPNESNR